MELRFVAGLCTGVYELVALLRIPVQQPDLNPASSQCFFKHGKIATTIMIRVSVVWLFRRASLACPDEGVWAYVGWGRAAVLAGLCLGVYEIFVRYFGYQSSSRTSMPLPSSPF